MSRDLSELHRVSTSGIHIQKELSKLYRLLANDPMNEPIMNFQIKGNAQFLRVLCPTRAPSEEGTRLIMMISL